MIHTRRLSSRLGLVAAIGLAFAALPACSTARKAPESARPDAAQPVPDAAGPGSSNATNDPANYGPQPAPDPSTYGPEPVQTRSLVVVLGPGLARGFAHVGALRALSEAHIPIAAVVGADMGAVIGAVYATSTTINGFEFSLLHIKPEQFYDKPGVLAAFRRDRNDGEALEKALRRILGDKQFKDAKVTFKAMLRRVRSGDDVLAESGDLAPAVRAAGANPRFMQDGSWAGVPAHSSIETRPYPVAEAKALNLGPVLVVDALADLKLPPGAGEDEQAAFRQLRLARVRGERDLAAADLVITPRLSAVAALDFARRSEAVFQGKAAVQRRIGEIRHLIGLPPEGLATE
jgi:NTE family protein